MSKSDLKVSRRRLKRLSEILRIARGKDVMLGDLTLKVSRTGARNDIDILKRAGLLRVKAVVMSGKAGRPAHIYGLTRAGAGMIKRLKGV